MSKSSLIALMIAVVFASSTCTWALYAWLFPALHVKTRLGVACGVLVAAALNYYLAKQKWHTSVSAIAAITTVALTFYVSMLLLVNTLGE